MFSERLEEAINNNTSSQKADHKETHELLAIITQWFKRIKDQQIADSKKIVNALHELQSNQKADSQNVVKALHELQATLTKELRKASKPNKIVAFLEDDTTIFLMKIAIVGGISYGCWKWMGFSVSGIINGTKLKVRGTTKSISKRVGIKFATVSEKMAHWTEQLENYGKPDEPNDEMPNINTQVSEVRQDISNCGIKSDFKDKISELKPVEGLGIPCKLFRMDEQDIVAEAMWVTDDPTTLVHGCELGRNASKVWVMKAIDPKAKVWRPTNGIQIMEEAETTTIAWPTDHIINDA